MKPYASLRDLENIVLEESFVREIHASPGLVTFEIEFALTREHPSYVAPPSDQSECFRAGRLSFHGVRRLVWSKQGAPPATDASGETDLGHIDSFAWDDAKYQLEGDWGKMEIIGAGLTVGLGQ